jgi:hypothetical protein
MQASPAAILPSPDFILRRVVFSRQGFGRFAGALTGWKWSLSGGKMSSTTMVTVAPVSR